MEESGVVSFNEHLNPVHYLEESSVDYMNTIRDRFEIYVSKFNEFRSNNKNEAQIKIFKISNTVNDFMLYRHSLRLIFARKAHDLITIGFLSSNGELFAARVNNSNREETKRSPHKIKAHVGPFNRISWRFEGEIIDIDSLTRHYLSEFIRCSAR